MNNEISTIGNDGTFKPGHLWWIQGSRLTNDTVINTPPEIVVVHTTSKAFTSFIRTGYGDFLLPWPTASLTEIDDKLIVMYHHPTPILGTRSWWYRLWPAAA